MVSARKFTMIGALLLLLGIILPWVTLDAGGFSRLEIAGWEGDGVYTGGIGFLLFLIAAFSPGKPGKKYSIAGTVLAVIAGLILMIDGAEVSRQGSLAWMTGAADVRIGSGIVISMFGALAAFIGCLMDVPGSLSDTQPSPRK